MKDIQGFERNFGKITYSKDQVLEVLKRINPNIPEGATISFREHHPGWSIDVDWEYSSNAIIVEPDSRRKP